MTYAQTLDYLYTQLPMFTRDGASAFKKDLTNTIALCSKLNNPQHKFKSIHVGGTNGKGSTSHMLAAVLQMAGYKTGLYTSPHLKDFRERIRVNGQMISEQTVVDFVAEHLNDFDEIRPSFFEMTVALAFDVFAKEAVDIAVIEVGLGGRLDSTNVITPILSVITNIGWDHMNMLGDTLQLIASEKAGIIKPNIPVVIGEYQEEVSSVFKAKAAEQNAPIFYASQYFDLVGKDLIEMSGSQYLELVITRKSAPELDLLPLTFQLDLTGSYQIKNLKTVLASVEQIHSMEYSKITMEHVMEALQQVKTLTGLRGRWDVLGRNPLVICDTGHNPEGIAEVMQNIAATPYAQLHFVIGMVNDKDHGKVLALLPKNAIYYFCKPDIPRGLGADTLQQRAADFGLYGDVYPDVPAAFAAAKQAARTDDLVFVGGSTFVVAEVV